MISLQKGLTGICWSPDDKYIFIQVVDRSQHKMALNMYKASERFAHDSKRGKPRLGRASRPLLYKRHLFIPLQDRQRDGYRKLYLCDTLGFVRLLTKADADVSM